MTSALTGPDNFGYGVTNIAVVGGEEDL
jgi:hypothetical protein